MMQIGLRVTVLPPVAVCERLFQLRMKLLEHKLPSVALFTAKQKLSSIFYITTNFKFPRWAIAQW